MKFQLHERLARDTVAVGQLGLSELLLMNDANYPWVILVPMREGIQELFELAEAEQQLLMREISIFSHLMLKHFKGDKMNVATLGNVVPQLHVHLIVRFREDAAWPKPVWGAMASKVYLDDELTMRLDQLKGLMTQAMASLN